MNENNDNQNSENKNSGLIQEEKVMKWSMWLKKIRPHFISILFPLFCIIIGVIYGSHYSRSVDENYKLNSLSKELEFNIRELQRADDILKGFEDYFNTKYNLIVKKKVISDFPVMPLFMDTTVYSVELISKDDPIWSLIKNITFKPLLMNENYISLSASGLIYELKNDEDIKFLKKLYSDDFRVQIDSLLEKVFFELKNFPIRPKVKPNKEKAEELKKQLIRQKSMILNQIQKVRRQINESKKRLEEINKIVATIIE